MSQVKTIFKNMSWLFVSQVFGAICAFVWTVLIARYLSVSDYGIMNFAVSFTGMIAITMDLGISTHIVRHIATDFDSSPKYLGNSLPLKSIFSAFTFFLALIILILMHCNGLTIQITLLFTIERIFASFTGLFNGSLQAVEEGKYQAIGNFLLNILLLIFMLLTITCDYGLYGITFAYLIANSIVFLSQYIAVKKRVSKPKLEFDKEFCKKITILSIPFALTSFFGIVLYSVDMVMLTNMVNSYANGIYSAAYKLISVLVLFYSVYSTVIFPVMSRFYKNEKNLLVVSLEKSIKYLMLFMIPISFATIFYSQEIVVLFFGHKYAPTSSVLSILICTVPLTFITGACQNTLNASHKEKYVTLTLLIATLFNIVSNFFIIPRYSYDGAAYTNILSDIIIGILYFYSIYKLDLMPNNKLYWDLLKMIIASIILYVTLTVLNINMWFALPIGIIVYLIVIIILKTFDDDDKFIIKEILGKT